MKIESFKRRPECCECRDEAVITIVVGTGPNSMTLSLCEACAGDLNSNIERAMMELG